MPESSEPDLSIVPRFIAHLEPRDAGAADLARQLLDAGWQVNSVWGPVQMDVWELRLHRDGVAVRFGVERGMSDSVLIGSAECTYNDLRPLKYAVLGWARATGTALPFEDPDAFLPDYSRYGASAAEWLRAGGAETYDRITAALQQYSIRRHSLDQRLGDGWLAETKAWGVHLLEAAAAPVVIRADRTP